jgi:hypothetical protein
MNDKFLREARDYTSLFCLEYEIDPDLARSNLEERLKDKRVRVRDLTHRFIEERIPGGVHG